MTGHPLWLIRSQNIEPKRQFKREVKEELEETIKEIREELRRALGKEVKQDPSQEIEQQSRDGNSVPIDSVKPAKLKAPKDQQASDQTSTENLDTPRPARPNELDPLDDDMRKDRDDSKVGIKQGHDPWAPEQRGTKQHERDNSLKHESKSASRPQGSERELKRRKEHDGY
ncbi:hypothetical protein K470DRAFT_296328 [Piedraia hortae CBS 480.64]|uniref:Uncharacterized protein n=1 Tax=Piedraia hortae CBS 480.64 TaxID=1314780 RepID=A0A6A7BUX5_9PEZI|nr:hypothetical protein K470DRAFT_296328 [Piedraia hortae CBS 480.64]